MTNIYQNIKTASQKGEKLLAVLIDPDKMTTAMLPSFMEKLNASIATHIFVGGSEVADTLTDHLVSAIKKESELPIILFPGDVTQITEKADALLFLSLISGRNPDYLIGKHVKAAAMLKSSTLEVIPTGYILVENLPAGRHGGKETSVQRVTKTQAMSRTEIQNVVNTALAGALLGHKLMYLEAGSGATHPIPLGMISEVKKAIKIPLIVGGGIRTKEQLDQAYAAGADLVVMGTVFEDNDSFINELI